jgi:hypothetical protein
LVIVGASLPVSMVLPSDDSSDLSQLFLECVDYVRNLGSHGDLISGNIGSLPCEKKRSYQTFNDVPWGWAATKIMELLQAYPSGLTSVILRYGSGIRFSWFSISVFEQTLDFTDDKQTIQY